MISSTLRQSDPPTLSTTFAGRSRRCPPRSRVIPLVDRGIYPSHRYCTIVLCVMISLHPRAACTVSITAHHDVCRMNISLLSAAFFARRRFQGNGEARSLGGSPVTLSRRLIGYQPTRSHRRSSSPRPRPGSSQCILVSE